MDREREVCGLCAVFVAVWCPQQSRCVYAQCENGEKVIKKTRDLIGTMKNIQT